MENLNKIIAKNLIHYRTQAGLTQLELAEKINYSDKSISKWERGDGIPDVYVLVNLAKIYGITVNDLLDDKDITEIDDVVPMEAKNGKKFYITLLSIGLTWFVATLVYAILYIIPSTKDFAWISFIYAIPVSGIVFQVFSAMWGNPLTNVIASSIILWGTLISICISFTIHTIWIICVAGAVFELLIIIWFMFRKYIKEKFFKKEDTNE